jgi:methionine synthase I (cobalamin-dependent)
MTDTGVSSRVKTFRDQLSRRVLVADGAMGTMLYDKGIFINRCYDELNLTAPDMIRQIHADYVKAGAEILETNTFGANRMRLAAFGLGEKLRAINQAGRGWSAGRQYRAAGTHFVRRGPLDFPRAGRGAGGSGSGPADP